MAKTVKALVVGVDHAAVNPGIFEVIVTWMKPGFSFIDDHGDIVAIKPKKMKRKVFWNSYPEIGSWIEVQLANIPKPISGL